MLFQQLPAPAVMQRGRQACRTERAFLAEWNNDAQKVWVWVGICSHKVLPGHHCIFWLLCRSKRGTDALSFLARKLCHRLNMHWCNYSHQSIDERYAFWAGMLATTRAPCTRWTSQQPPRCAPCCNPPLVPGPSDVAKPQLLMLAICCSHWAGKHTTAQLCLRHLFSPDLATATILGSTLLSPLFPAPSDSANL